MGFLSNLLSRTLFRSTFGDIDRLMEDVRTGKPIPETKPDPKSGVLSIDDQTLSYTSPDYGNWQIPIDEVVAFGEYTTDNGPHIDDWFLVFVTTDFNWVEASNYCAGCDSVRDGLAKHWGVESLRSGLSFSTDFNSRALWPTAIAGEPLFDFVERPQSVWQKITSFGIGLIDKDITKQVRIHLQSHQKS
jgi:hypothetical protein